VDTSGLNDAALAEAEAKEERARARRADLGS